MMGECKLCKKSSVLRKSHILPEFMYQNLYDKDVRRFYSLTVNLDEAKNSKQKIEQKGIREYLLCNECEVLLSKYENYAAETLYGKNSKNKSYITSSSQTPDLQYFTYEYAGFDYKKMKIFLLSILWRIIISKTFVTPTISNDTVERLRIAISNEDPLKYNEFGCLVQILKYKKDQLVKGFILSPYMSGVDGNILNILVDSFVFSFYLNQSDVSDESFLLKEDGTMIVFGRVIFQDIDLVNRLKAAFDTFK
jgi:hypothetical protein